MKKSLLTIVTIMMAAMTMYADPAFTTKQVAVNTATEQFSYW